MSLPAAGPGKTAPRLFHDFLIFDPYRLHHGQNLLVLSPNPVGEGPLFSPYIGACKHEYTTKFQQSIVPPLDHRPDTSTIYKTAVVCKKCRLHADIRLTFEHSTNPCPNSEHPLHHFQILPHEEQAAQDRIRYGWQCSSASCRAQLRIVLKAPRLTEDDRDLVSNPERLKRRYEDVLREQPNREGVQQASPMGALGRMRRYIQDSLNPDRTQRIIQGNQKRFCEVFGVKGQDCEELLMRLGFKLSDGCWQLPNPSLLSDQDRLRAEGITFREFLEDVNFELLAWMYKLSAENNMVNPAAAEGWSSADMDIKRTLAAQGYEVYSTVRRGPSTDSELLHYFASLGALIDFSDVLVDFAFSRQCMCDPERRPYYFECLQVIAEARQTEGLTMRVAMLASQDCISRRDLSSAYRHLNISNPSHCDDDRVLELFHVRQSDLGAQAQEDARQALNKIGIFRGSMRLINASRQQIETYEDALAWLGNGVSKETNDESLLAVVALRVGDNKSLEEVAQKAISVIARERKSNYLNNWLATGRADGYEMSTDEALRHLGIESNFSDIERSVLPAVFDSARADRPGEQTENAIRIIQSAIEGGALLSHPPETWPVGLRSHGNTCYLNSLLQYYFSLKPLRDIILNYRDYALDTSQVTEKKERVGQRMISMVEIKGGQRFADDLMRLFGQMIQEPGDSVMPEEELVCRAFLEPKDYELLAPDVKTEAELPAEVSQTSSDAIMNAEPTLSAPGDVEKGHESDASSVTLQGSQNDNNDVSKEAEAALPTPPSSPVPGILDQKAEPPDVPPLPPRRVPTSSTQEALSKAQSNARQQQDVTEVHDGVMFRLRSGMMPRGMDNGGEQIDALRHLFSIALDEVPVKDGKEGPKKSLLDSSLQLNVPNEAKDIYTALDEIFDLQAYDENGAMETYKSITELPPLLQINIPRIGYDNVRGAYKSNACIRLREELYLDRYIDGLDPRILPLRKTCWGWRKQLNALEKERNTLKKGPYDLDGPSAVAETAKYLNRVSDLNKDLESVGLDWIEIDPELPSILSRDGQSQSDRLVELEQQINEVSEHLGPQFETFKSVKYRLAAAFFHRGDYGHGHYWIYIYDFENDMWRKYNDEKVEEFPKAQMNEILEATEWNHGTPTYAVYVQDQNKTEIVQPVCRAPEKPPNAEVSQPADAEMANDEVQTEVEAQGWNAEKRESQNIMW